MENPIPERGLEQGWDEKSRKPRPRRPHPSPPLPLTPSERGQVQLPLPLPPQRRPWIRTGGTGPRFSWKSPSGWGALPPPLSLSLWPEKSLICCRQRAVGAPPLPHPPLGNSPLPEPSKLSQLLLACHMLKKTNERRHCILFRPQ